MKDASNSLATSFWFDETKEGKKYWLDVHDNMATIAFNIPMFNRVLVK